MVVELVVLPPEPEDVFSAVRHTSFCEMVLTLSPAPSVKKSPAYISMRGNMVEGGGALAIGERKRSLLIKTYCSTFVFPYRYISILRRVRTPHSDIGH